MGCTIRVSSDHPTPGSSFYRHRPEVSWEKRLEGCPPLVLVMAPGEATQSTPEPLLWSPISEQEDRTFLGSCNSNVSALYLCVLTL